MRAPAQTTNISVTVHRPLLKVSFKCHWASSGRKSDIEDGKNEHLHHFKFKESKGGSNDIINCVVRNFLLATAIVKTQLSSHAGVGEKNNK